MMKKVYVSFKIPEQGIEELKKHFIVHVNQEDKAVSREWLVKNIKDYYGILSMLHDKIDAEIMDAANGGLKIISNYAVGYNNIDIPYAVRSGITVTNTPGVLTVATAELAFALMMSLLRNIPQSDRYVKNGEFDMWRPKFMLGEELTGKTVGIIGMGRIGCAFARMLAGFDNRIIYYNRHRADNETESSLKAEYADLDTLLGESDIISIHAPLNEDTYHMFTYDTFTKMRRESYIINTGRGAIIKEDDLARALKEGLIRGAGLDVYEFEPEVNKELVNMDNTVLLPHIGSGSFYARNTMSSMAAQAIIDLHLGKKPEHVVEA